MGIAVAIFDFVFTAATVSSVDRVSRRSLALWSPQQRAFIDNQYNSGRIVTMQCKGNIFFGSSMQMLANILHQAGINIDVDEKAEISRVNSPIPHRRINSLRIPQSLSPASVSVSPGSGRLEKRQKERKQQTEEKRLIVTSSISPPRFLVLDLSTGEFVHMTWF